MRSGPASSRAWRARAEMLPLTFLGQQIYAKQLELLKEAIPSVARIAVLMNPDNPANRPVLQSLSQWGMG